MPQGKNPPKEAPKRGKEADNAKTSKGRTNNAEPSGKLTAKQKDDLLGKGENPIVGSQRHADKHGW